MTLPDQEYRDAIANDLGVNLMVEAAAGTGKTTSLVTRAVNLIRTGRCTIDTLAAITFTVKAAAQLRERLHEALEKTDPSGGDARIRAAIENLDRAFVGTTHAFCARMLRERPVESAIDPDFEELDEVATTLLMDDFWSLWYDAQAIKDSETLHNVRGAGVRAGLLRSAFFRLVDYADVEIVAAPCECPDLRPAVDVVLDFLREVEPNLPTDQMREKQDDFEWVMRTLVRKRESSDLEETLEQLLFLEAGDHASRKPVQKNWPDKKQAKAFGERYAEIVRNIVRPKLRQWREYVHCIVIDFLRPAVEEFESERRRNGTLTFNDLLVRARDLLRDHPFVRTYFQSRFTHILVDEFQDTDPIQAEVLFYLTGREVEEKNWRKLTPGRGSLFIVGDPKQSIYRFRRADITTYLAVKEQIEKSGGRVVPLSANFRSTRRICAFVNEIFPSLFTDDDVAAGRQASHVDLDGLSDGGTQSGAYAVETDGATVEIIATKEASFVAQWIRRAVESKLTIDDSGKKRRVQYGDFLLVSDRKARLRTYARALEDEGVPYEITGGEAFAESKDLQALMPLLRTVADPDDQSALAAFLRGPFCGASDDALYHFVRAGGRFSSSTRIPDEIDPAIAAGMEIVNDARQLSRSLPAAAAIARIFDRIGLTAFAALDEQGGTRAGNTLLALAIARRQSARGAGFAAIIDHLDDLLGSAAKVEELNVDPKASGVVRLMNLHQVKGLEAPVVFLVDPADAVTFEPDIYVDRSGDVSRGYIAIRERRRDVALPRDWERLAEEEERFQKAERMRLLYVAATRAKSLLFAGVTVKRGERKGVWASLVTNAKKIFSPGTAPRRLSQAILGSRFADARAAIERRHLRARAPSYSVLPITKVAHASHEELVRNEEGLGKGTSWGRVLHRLFEAMLRDEHLDVRRFAENLLKDEERDAVELEEVMRVVNAVQSSPLWTRAKSADERYVEVPFALTVPRRVVGIDEDGDTLLHGTIDLVFRERDRWLVVDYKSDSTKERLDALVSYYKPQVEHYARFWQQLTNVPTSASLFFVDGCKWIEVTPG